MKAGNPDSVIYIDGVPLEFCDKDISLTMDTHQNGELKEGEAIGTLSATGTLSKSGSRKMRRFLRRWKRRALIQCVRLLYRKDKESGE